ncbi:hypothetical protein MHM_03780 [Candidatus Mycoplasma haemominutum 'Birmingham 1']|uniref:Uncharacterized protein n=1 Tax=Candidatus Mycoplasma haematominutum 'Birmingham 1' TaxID=1116213 RepID=G8C3J8_9MOLU|nr:hypothetical protein MHM_03780 [Candidatus Mycoplasma haematominutum 'Birmingham 1']
MLSRRTKLLGGAALLLGAPSSTALSTLDLGKLSLDHLFNTSGGALT